MSLDEDSADLLKLLESLNESIKVLTKGLEPFLDTPHVELACKLPLLDKAKFYALVVYSIESLIFSTLKLNGVDAQEHPIFAELARTKTYFAKIKEAETASSEGEQHSLKLDKDAAARMIKHGIGPESAQEKRKSKIEERHGSEKQPRESPSSGQKRKHQKHRVKSNKAPRTGKDVFNDLLHRGSPKDTTDNKPD